MGAEPIHQLNDAQTDAATGTNAIKSQADSRAGMVNTGGYYTVTVSGQDTGTVSRGELRDGWSRLRETSGILIPMAMEGLPMISPGRSRAGPDQILLC